MADHVRSHLHDVRSRLDGPAPGDVLPPHYPTCLGCGPGAEQGFHLAVRREGDEVVASHVFESRHSGAPGIAHGGAVAVVLDDVPLQSRRSGGSRRLGGGAGRPDRRVDVPDPRRPAARLGLARCGVVRQGPASTLTDAGARMQQYRTIR